jgi:hypothetical protein
MIRRILLLKFVSWVVLSPVLALAPTPTPTPTLHIRFSGVPHPSHPLANVGAWNPASDGPRRISHGVLCVVEAIATHTCRKRKDEAPLRW